MIYESDIEQEIVAKSFDECKEKLYRMYGADYRITQKIEDSRPGGFLWLQSVPVIKVKYIVNHRKAYEQRVELTSPQSEEERLEKNKEAILNSQREALLSVTIKQMSKKIDELQNSFNDRMNPYAIAQDKHENIKRIEELLGQNEFTFNYISMIQEKIRSEFSLEQLEDFSLMQNKVVNWIGETINIAQKRVRRNPYTVIIVGPTGVGKTTTLVKLATQFMISFKDQGRKAEFCFVTTDSMRVGAIEQLSRFGELMRVNVLKAETSEDLRSIYNEYKEKVDAIFIDTSGYSPNDATHIGNMKMLLDIPGMNPEVYLAFSASTKARDIKNIMKNYEPFGYSSVIVTKCDESQQFGNVISSLQENHKSISYYTHGQNAAGAITRANVVDFLIRLDGFDIDRQQIENKFGEN